MWCAPTVPNDRPAPARAEAGPARPPTPRACAAPSAAGLGPCGPCTGLYDSGFGSATAVGPPGAPLGSVGDPSDSPSSGLDDCVGDEEESLLDDESPSEPAQSVPLPPESVLLWGFDSPGLSRQLNAPSMRP